MGSKPGLPNKVCPRFVIPRAGAVARSRNLGQALFGSPVKCFGMAGVTQQVFWHGSKVDYWATL